MHCELIVPGLFAEAADTRAPALELLLARGRGTNGESHSVESWLQEAFGLEDAPIAAGALTLVANGTDPGGACWARADPVHLRLLRDRLIVVPGAAFELTAAEAHALVDALNGHFAGALHLQATDAYRWCLRLEDPLAFHSVPPIEAAGRDVDLTARIGGEAGKRWKQVLTEAQMLLHAHPVNQAREEHGLPAVNSLWLWGAGSAPAVPAGRWRTVAATDPLPLGLARLGGARALALPPDGAAWLGALPAEGRHLAVLDELRAPLALGHTAELHDLIGVLETRWFAPLLAALRNGRVGMISVHVPDNVGAAFEVVRGDLRRFWRRRKALASYA